MAYKKIVMGIFCFIYTKSILWLTVYLDKFYSCYLDITIRFRINIGQLTVDSTKCKTIILLTCWLMTDSWQTGNNFLNIQNFKVRLCGLLLFILSENSHILKTKLIPRSLGILRKRHILFICETSRFFINHVRMFTIYPNFVVLHT